MKPLLKRARHAILPAVAVAAWGVAIAMTADDRADLDADDRLALAIAIVATVWTLIDWYYRKLSRDRREAHAGHDVDLLAKGVAAFARQEEADGRGQRG